MNKIEILKETIKESVDRNFVYGLKSFAIYNGTNNYETAKEKLIKELIEPTKTLEDEAEGLLNLSSELDKMLYEFLSSSIDEMVDSYKKEATEKIRPDFKEIAVEDFLDGVLGNVTEGKSAPELLEISDYVTSHGLHGPNESRVKTIDERQDYVLSKTKSIPGLEEIITSFIDSIKDQDYISGERKSIDKKLKEEIEFGITEEELDELKRNYEGRIDFLTKVKNDENEIFTKVISGKIIKILNKIMTNKEDEIRDEIIDGLSDETAISTEPISSDDVVAYMEKSEFFKKIYEGFGNYIGQERIQDLFVSELNKKDKKQL